MTTMFIEVHDDDTLETLLPSDIDEWRDVDDDLAVVCDALGVARHRLLLALECGASIADVAGERDVDPQTVIDALAVDQQEDLLERLEHREVTNAQAAAIYSRIADRAAQLVFRRGIGLSPL